MALDADFLSQACDAFFLQQEHLVGTDIMGSVLDDMLTDRPLAILVLLLDGVAIIAILILLMRMTYVVLHEGPLTGGENLLVAAVAAVNIFFLVRQARNSAARQRLQLAWKGWDMFDLATAVLIFAVCAMARSEALRLGDTFLVVATLACGCSWVKLLRYVAGLQMKFALYIQAISHITVALRSFLFLLTIVLGMFGNMFYIIMMVPRSEQSGDDGDDGPFERVDESFLSLFQMVLGAYEREWFVKGASARSGLSVFAVLLFVVYMGLVFVIMLNVLIAVVCDNYDFAMSKAHELFLRSRLALVADLELHGYTRPTPAVGGAIGALVQRLHGTWAHRKVGGLFAVRTRWVDADQRVGDWEAGGGDGKAAETDEWTGRVNHMERAVGRIVGTRVSECEARVAAAEGIILQALERLEKRSAAERGEGTPQRAEALVARAVEAAIAGVNRTRNEEGDAEAEAAKRRIRQQLQQRRSNK